MGLLAISPMSGYDIKKKIETSTSNFWNESYGQIYPILRKLAAQGLLAKSVEEKWGRPDRHVYKLTDKGQQELQNWLVEPAEAQTERIEILLKLFFGQQVTVADNIRHIEQFRQMQQQLLQKYSAIAQQLQAKETQETDNPHIPYWQMTANYKLHATKALIDWCDESLAKLSKLLAAET